MIFQVILIYINLAFIKNIPHWLTRILAAIYPQERYYAKRHRGKEGGIYFHPLLRTERPHKSINLSKIKHLSTHTHTKPHKSKIHTTLHTYFHLGDFLQKHKNLFSLHNFAKNLIVHEREEGGGYTQIRRPEL